MLVFTKNNQRRKVKFELLTDVSSASVAWSRWRYQFSCVHEHCGPRNVSKDAAEELVYDQCVFIHALRVYRRNKLLFLKVMKAAADPNDSGPGYPPENDSSATRTPDESFGQSA